jgi:single-strand DNA-binding protein
MNVWVFTGNLGGDPVVRYLPGGGPVMNFSVASKSGYGDSEKTSWVDCFMFGERGEKLEPFLKKGLKVTIAGEAALNTYNRKTDGKEVTRLVCKVSDLELPPKPKDDAAPPVQAGPGGDINHDVPFAPYQKGSFA